MSLSVVIITHNEAHNIVECLRSVEFAHEVVVLDSASGDATRQMAQEMGARVYTRGDWRGFGEQKNRALALASGDWVFALDADERVSPTLAREIEAAIAAHPQGCVMELPRLSSFCGKWIRHCGWHPDYVPRIFPRHAARFSDALVHESLVVHAPLPVVRLKQVLLHYSYRDAQEYFVKLQKYSLAWAQQRFAQGRRGSIARAVAAGVFAFLRSYLLRLGFLDGKMGLVVCIMQSQAAFGKYFCLYDLHRHARESMVD